VVARPNLGRRWDQCDEFVKRVPKDILHTRPEESVWPDVVHYIHFYFCVVNTLHYAWVWFPIVRHYAELAIQ